MAAAVEQTGPPSAGKLEVEGVPQSTFTAQRMSWAGRDVGCGRLTDADVGRSVTLAGWVHRYRNLGGVCFVDLRDGTGILQVRPLSKLSETF